VRVVLLAVVVPPFHSQANPPRRKNERTQKGEETSF